MGEQVSQEIFLDAVLPLWNTARDMRKQPRLQPSNQLRKAIDLYGGVNPASKAWGIEYVSLKRWLTGHGGISDGTMLAIERGSGLSHQQAFTVKSV